MWQASAARGTRHRNRRPTLRQPHVEIEQRRPRAEQPMPASAGTWPARRDRARPRGFMSGAAATVEQSHRAPRNSTRRAAARTENGRGSRPQRRRGRQRIGEHCGMAGQRLASPLRAQGHDHRTPVAAAIQRAPPPPNKAAATAAAAVMLPMPIAGQTRSRSRTRHRSRTQRRRGRCFIHRRCDGEVGGPSRASAVTRRSHQPCVRAD